jgi:hypothetical protein
LGISQACRLQIVNQAIEYNTFENASTPNQWNAAIMPKVTIGTPSIIRQGCLTTKLKSGAMMHFMNSSKM